MTITQFIERAIEGGWKCTNEWGSNPHDMPFERILLDPLAWQAVGKIEGWREDVRGLRWREEIPHDHDNNACPEWIDKMHRMIDALIEGKTIEVYLETL